MGHSFRHMYLCSVREGGDLGVVQARQSLLKGRTALFTEAIFGICYSVRSVVMQYGDVCGAR